MKTTIETIRTNYPKLSLKKICEVTGVCYQYVLKASKKPRAGVVYDADFFNCDEVDKIFERKNVNFDDYDWQKIESEIAIVAPINMIEDFKIGVEFNLRESCEDKVGCVYEVIYTTETHIVFKAAASTQPRVMNFDTFIHQSPRLVK